MKKLVIILIFIILLQCSLTAIDLGGSLILDYYGLIDPETVYENERLRCTIVPEIAYKDKESWFTFYLNGMVYYQLLEEPYIPDPERFVREAYMGFHLGPLDMYLGQKFVCRGKVDVLSPLDVVNHSDTTVLSIDDAFESSLPDPLAHIEYYITDSLQVEFVYVPFLIPSIYSIENITIEEYEEQQYGGTTYVYNINAAFMNKEIPIFSEWAHSIHTALNFSTDHFDLIATYSNYIDKLPDFDLSGIEETITTIGAVETHDIEGTAYPAFNRVHHFGLGTSFYCFDFLISVDSAITLTEDMDGTRVDIRNNELFSAFQVERNFFSNLRVQFNIFNKVIFDADAMIETEYSPAVENQIKSIINNYTLQIPSFQIYLLLHLNAHFLRETLFVGGNLLYGNEEDEHAIYCAPRISYVINDYVSLSASAHFWWGGIIEGYLGRNTTKDNFYVQATLTL